MPRAKQRLYLAWTLAFTDSYAATKNSQSFRAVLGAALITSALARKTSSKGFTLLVTGHLRTLMPPPGTANPFRLFLGWPRSTSASAYNLKNKKPKKKRIQQFRKTVKLLHIPLLLHESSLKRKKPSLISS